MKTTDLIAALSMDASAGRDSARRRFYGSAVAGAVVTAGVFLLSLAVHHGGCLVSFDRSIALAAVPGAKAQHLLVLGA
jgi:hypothetical protein